LTNFIDVMFNIWVASLLDRGQGQLQGREGRPRTF